MKMETLDTAPTQTITCVGEILVELSGAGDPLLSAGDIEISREEISSPVKFLANDRGKAWFKTLVSNVYYTRWYDYQRSPYERKWCNELAEKILDLKYGGASPGEVEDAIEEKFSGGEDAEDAYEDHLEDDVKQNIQDIAEILAEMRENDETIPELNCDEWKEVVKEHIVEYMYEQDDSSVLDMLSSHDFCEIIIPLGGSEDVYSNRSWADFDDLTINEELQRALAALGYTIADYRKMSGNRGPSSHLPRRFKRRVQPLVNEEELRSLVNEACSTYFTFILYAMVPVKELIELDLTKPVALSNYAIASYSDTSGTFFDILRKTAITIMPEDGKIQPPTGYSPEDICGLHPPPYKARIANIMH